MKHGKELFGARGRWLASPLSALCAFLFASGAFALGGTHGNTVSTWDTTRSTVVMSYHHGFMLEGGYMNTAGYNANFTSTSGRLSAQFGLSYVGVKLDELGMGMHGVSGSAVAVYGIPIGKRYDNGLPKAAFTFFGGSVPTAVFNGRNNNLSIPINMGFGVEINPAKAISIIPWFEFAPSFNLDTVIDPDVFRQDLTDSVNEDDILITYNPDGSVNNVDVNEDVINNLVSEAVELDFSFAIRMRGGLSIVLNLGDKVDLQLNAAVAQVGEDFSDKPTIFVGGAFVFAWDDPPAAILPEEQRLRKMSCNAVAQRYTSCADYKNLVENIRKREREKLEEEMAREKEQAVPEEPEEEYVPQVQQPASPKPLSPAGVGGSSSEPEPELESAPAPEVEDGPAPQPVGMPSLSEPLSK